MTQTELLQRIKELLQALYGARFRGLVLYGSVARGDAREDSDIDLLCLLDGLVGSWEIIKINDVTYPLRLITDRQFHIMPANVTDFEAGEFGIYRAVRHEGVPV